MQFALASGTTSGLKRKLGPAKPPSGILDEASDNMMKRTGDSGDGASDPVKAVGLFQ